MSYFIYCYFHQRREPLTPGTRFCPMARYTPEELSRLAEQARQDTQGDALNRIVTALETLVKNRTPRPSGVRPWKEEPAPIQPFPGRIAPRRGLDAQP